MVKRNRVSCSDGSGFKSRALLYGVPILLSMGLFLFIIINVVNAATTSTSINFNDPYDVIYTFKDKTKKIDSWQLVPQIIKIDVLQECYDQLENGTCLNGKYKKQDYTIYINQLVKTDFIYRKQKIINISQGNNSIIIKGDCCEYYAESPYNQFEGLSVISCKEEINYICNPLIQQSAPDPSVYDEAGSIIVFSGYDIKVYDVGRTPYNKYKKVVNLA